jgi:Flp pilus assembly protein TadD
VPTSLPIHELLAALGTKLGRFAEAELAVRSGLDLDPNHQDLLRLLALLEEHNGRPDTAAVAYDRLLKISPFDSAARLGKARCAALRGHRVLAGLLLDELRSDPAVGAEAAAFLARIQKPGSAPPSALTSELLPGCRESAAAT